MAMQNYLIIGGTGGIGQAMVEQIIKNSLNKPMHIYATYHQRQPDLQADNLSWIQMDVSSEASIQAAIAEVQSQTDHIDWVINAVGMLHSESNGPEKGIRQLEPDYFMQNMAINALPSLLIAKHIKPLLVKPVLKAAEGQSGSPETLETQSPTIYATISARVGSISDNQLGGWYSYRMSKAALNMGMKTLAIEWSRTLKHVCVVVMQPGTVDTELSKPFQGNVPEGKLFTAEYSAQKLLDVLSSMTAEQSGCFVDWSGATIAW